MSGKKCVELMNKQYYSKFSKLFMKSPISLD